MLKQLETRSHWACTNKNTQWPHLRQERQKQRSGRTERRKTNLQVAKPLLK